MVQNKNSSQNRAKIILWENSEIINLFKITVNLYTYWASSYRDSNAVWWRIFKGRGSPTKQKVKTHIYFSQERVSHSKAVFSAILWCKTKITAEGIPKYYQVKILR